MITETICALVLATAPSISTQPLDLPTDSPGAFTVAVERGPEPLRLTLQRHALRDRGARVRVYQDDGTYAVVAPPPPSTYRGVIEGAPDTVVVASLAADGLTATVFPVDGEPWTIVPSDPADQAIDHLGGGLHTIGGSIERFEPDACGVADGPQPDLPETPVAAADGPACQFLCQIAFDADFEYYQLKGSSVANVVAAIDAHMNQVDFFYARDVNISYSITDYVVRTAPFYTPVSGGDLLDQFRAEWNTNQTAIVRDIAHLMTDKPGSIIEFGGLAWVGVVCTNSAYGWSLDSAGIVGHEIGHNWAAPHCLDPSPCNAMCGACLNIGPVTRQVIIAHRDSRGCLDAIGPYAQALPPFVAPESATVRRHRLDTKGPLSFDVLGNDDDGNCNPIVIDSHDIVSERGAMISLSAGSGPEGRDELVYTLPEIPFLGDDAFQYVVGDGTGQATIGTVSVTSRPSTLRGYWPLDAASTQIDDATGNGHDGAPVGAPAATPGVVGNALAFDGDDSVSIPALGLDTDEITISGWVRRTGTQAAFAGVVFSRGETTVSGLSFGFANELRYTWNNAIGTFGWDSGLVVPDGTWTFVALVVEPDRATLYMHDGTTMQSAVNFFAHEVEAFDAPMHLGLDPSSPVRHFDGALDDVRIHDYALTATEIASLQAGLGRAEAPIPADGGRLIEPGLDLRWVPGPGAEEHDVYFGTDYAAVRDATTASSEYQGRTSIAQFNPGLLTPDVTHFWRIDEVSSGAIVPGIVWQFSPARARRWPLDETTGITADDAFGNDDGTFISGPLLGQPAPTAALGTSIALDGINDRVELPVLDMDSAHVTMSAWIKRDGPQADAAGLVFSRAASTIAGLNLGAAEDLRYHWNDSYWWWGSGLDVPDGQWAFVALVIEPEQATLYMGVDGVLTSATNVAAHAPEEFDGPTQIGQGIPGGRYFRGDVDDVRIHDDSLTAAQIETLYLASGIGDPCGDLDGSGTVDFADILAAIGAWGACAACPEDLDGSGDVGFGDVLYIIGRWGNSCP